MQGSAIRAVEIVFPLLLFGSGSSRN